MRDSNEMIRYEEIKEEIQLSQMEIQDEIDYYQKKIEEFQKKKSGKEKILNGYKKKLDQYVISDYKKDTEKAWFHFMSTEKTEETYLFFDKFLTNTGFQVSKYDKKEVKFLLFPNNISNIKKSAKILNALFSMVKKYEIENFKIQVMNIKKAKAGEMFIYKVKNDYIFKSEDAKRSTIREENNILFLDKIIIFSEGKE